MVNAAIYPWWPLLVTGRPGAGKSSPVYLVARELGLGPVLPWPVTSWTFLRGGLYAYDVIGRVQELNVLRGVEPDVGQPAHLGPLGTALLPYERPRGLLIDDLPNMFKDSEFEIPGLAQFPAWHPEMTVLTDDRDAPAVVQRSREQEFPAQFLWRLLKLHVDPPTSRQLSAMVAMQFGDTDGVDVQRLITEFWEWGIYALSGRCS